MSTGKKNGDHHKTSGNHDIGGNKKQDNSDITEPGNRNQSQGHGSRARHLSFSCLLTAPQGGWSRPSG